MSKATLMEGAWLGGVCAPTLSKAILVWGSICRTVPRPTPSMLSRQGSFSN